MMDNPSTRWRRHDPVFVTSASSPVEVASVRLLAESIRSFGGELSSCPIWMFAEEGLMERSDLPSELGVDTRLLTIPDSIRGYELAEKVAACAAAERGVDPSITSLAWVSSDTLVVNPPVRFLLSDSHDAALRPVHIRNIGISADQPLDDFWRRVIRCAGLEDTEYHVESFVDRQLIRAYFNSHSYCVNPSVGLFRAWLRCFEELVMDKDFQDSACSDDLHRTFLHQAVLSVLTVAMIDPGRIAVLPPTYSYPYNLSAVLPFDRRARSLEELVTVVYEEMTLDPGSIHDIEIHEPLRSWLAERAVRR
jgi:hypothetical protein